MLARIGNLIMAWNAIEHWMRLFVSRHTGDTWETVVAAAEKKGGPLIGRLSAAASNFSSSDVADRIRHFAEAFDRLREHRNRVVHRFKDVWPRKDGTVAALFWDINKDGIAHEYVSDAEIAELVNQCWTFEDYARRVMDATNDDGSVRAGGALPAKPTLPERFVESREQVPSEVLKPKST